MNDKQMEFERTQFPEMRSAFRQSIDINDTKELQSILKKLIFQKKYEELSEKIQSVYNFTIRSQFLEKMKQDWWRDFLTNNLHKSATDKIVLTDFEGNLLEFETEENVYKEFIQVKNETIWKPWENIFTKILTEWIVESVIEASNELSVSDRINFIKKSIFYIEKQQALEEYAKYQLNEQLNYYKNILELTLKDTSIDKFTYEDSSLFSNIIENDKIRRLKELLYEEKFDDFFKLISTIFASVPYQLYSKKEASFHTIFHVIAHLIKSNSRSEEPTNIGRIDTIIELEQKVFLFEFKLNDAYRAIEQIKQMKYYEKYLEQHKVLFLIGVGFSMEKRNINNWQAEKL